MQGGGVTIFPNSRNKTIMYFITALLLLQGRWRQSARWNRTNFSNSRNNTVMYFVTTLLLLQGRWRRSARWRIKHLSYSRKNTIMYFVTTLLMLQERWRQSAGWRRTPTPSTTGPSRDSTSQRCSSTSRGFPQFLLQNSSYNLQD